MEEQPVDLDGADYPISLQQAGMICGKSPDVLRYHAHRGELRTTRTAEGMLTTRRWLHAYLTRPPTTHRGRRLPPPAGEGAPE
jgi:hypothetical protein